MKVSEMTREQSMEILLQSKPGRCLEVHNGNDVIFHGRSPEEFVLLDPVGQTIKTFVDANEAVDYFFSEAGIGMN